MAKDTRGLDKNEVVKKDIAAKQAASDEKIVSTERIKPLTNEDGQRVEGPISPAQIAEANKLTEEGNKTRLEGLPTSGGAVKDDPAVPDPYTPKPTIEEITPGQDARAAARNVGTGVPARTTVLDFGKLPSRPEGGATAASVNVTEKPDVAINLIDRLKSGMGLPGEEQGHLDLALKLHESDREVAARTGKVVNDVQPNDPKATHLTVFGGHHHRLAKVMNTFKISDPEIYKNAASATGQRLATLVHGLHKIAQEHEDSKRTITHTPKEGAMWEHPETKEIIPVAANHPEMPSAFTRTKGKVARVSRDASGAVVTTRSHEGWDSMRVRGGTTVYRKYGAPKGIDLVDHMRAEMLSEHGISATSRKGHANRTTDILEQMNSSIPRDKKQIGVRKVAERTTPTVTSRPKAQRTKSPGAAKIYRLSPTNTETTEPLLVDKAKPGKAAGTKPNPPKARTGKMLVGTAPLDQPLGPKAKPTVNTAPPKRNAATQLMLPGTGEPKRVSTVIEKEERGSWQGPLTQDQMSRVDLSVPVPNPPKGSGAEQILEQGEPPTYSPSKARAKRDASRSKETFDSKEATDLVGSYSKVSYTKYKDASGKEVVKANRGSTVIPIDKESNIREVVTKPAKYGSELVPTDRDWKPQPTRSRQFTMDTTEMTGAEEVRALSNMRAFTHQQPSTSRELVVRPGGKKQAKRDARAAKAAPKPAEPEQLSLFPDHEVVPGRSNQFYMAGSVQPISDASATLQRSAKARFGKQPNNKDFETENEGSILNRLQAGSKKKD